MQNNRLIALVDENDIVTEYAEKQYVHENGLLHRAFSIIIFNSKGEMLLHQRSHAKYHSPSLWTNTCCSHLLQGLTMEECTHNRLVFEMGFNTELEFQLSFTYKIKFGNNLIEHETDHLYFGKWEGIPITNIDEVMAYKWIKPKQLIEDIQKRPDKYTYWFKHIVENYADRILNYK